MPNTRLRLPVGRYSTFGHISQASTVDDADHQEHDGQARRNTLGCVQRLIATTTATNQSAIALIGAMIASAMRCAATVAAAGGWQWMRGCVRRRRSCASPLLPPTTGNCVDDSCLKSSRIRRL